MNRLLKLAPAIAMIALAGAPSFAQPTVVTIDPAQTETSVSSMWSMSSTENGRTIKLEGRNGVVSAEVDGKAVPADRIVREGNTVKIKDDKGEVIYQTEVPSLDASNQTFSIKGRSPTLWWGNPGTISGFGSRSGSAPSAVLHADAELPKVMIGVQLLDPDSSLRGHLGLKEGEATLIGATYDGLPAAQAGLEPYDIIVGIDGKTPAGPEDVRLALHGLEPGKTISLDVIHRGQKKTVTITPEKYDRDKLDSAKVNAIAAATGTPSASALGGNPFAWNIQPGTTPIVGIPKSGKALTILPPSPGMNGVWDAQAMAEQMRQMVAQAQQQAEVARRQAEEMRRQMDKQLRGQIGPPAPGASGDLQDQMNEMMKEIKSLHDRLDQQNKPKSDDKSEGRS
jgi:hypothetical protein